jgi:Mg2+ and Co2+ transporter CorA
VRFGVVKTNVSAGRAAVATYGRRGSIQDVEDLLDPHAGPACRLVPAADAAERERELARVVPELADRAGIVLGLNRPEVQTAEAGTLLVLFTVDADLEPVRWVIAGSERGVLVIGDPAQADTLRETLHRLRPTSGAGVLRAVVLGLAKSVPTALEAGQQHVEGAAAARMSRGSRRRRLREVRAQLFTLQERLTAQSRLLEELGEEDAHDARRVVRRARADFEAGSTTAARLYALAGDELNEESALVNERLTLVSTLFLPATVTTGFFGMNFAWLVERVESQSAFVVLGLVIPMVVSALTLVIVTRLGAGRD